MGFTKSVLPTFGPVAVVLVISEVWRRATFRYLHDARRRQQFLALRRVAVGLALTIVVVFGLVSEVDQADHARIRGVQLVDAVVEHFNRHLGDWLNRLWHLIPLKS